MGVKWPYFAKMTPQKKGAGTSFFAGPLALNKNGRVLQEKVSL
jgi:hypothetical protein